LNIYYFRWVPPALPSSRSPEREKESTFAAGRSRVRFGWTFAEAFFHFPLLHVANALFSYKINMCFVSQRVEVERTLTDSQRDEFEDMLRALTLERSQIKEAMGFALDNADAAGEVKPTLYI
jgi:U2-associated protein SR140